VCFAALRHSCRPLYRWKQGYALHTHSFALQHSTSRQAEWVVAAFEQGIYWCHFARVDMLVLLRNAASAPIALLWWCRVTVT
jgi:hypothetical protein